MIRKQESVIIATISRLLAPFVQMFGLYVIMHGHSSPGGGFQGGVILGASFILLAIGCGSEDRGYQDSLAFHQTLERIGVNHIWFGSPGTHEWQVWRRHLFHFAQLLFRDETRRVPSGEESSSHSGEPAVGENL